MKSILTTIAFICTFLFTKSQSSQNIPKEVKQYANAAGEKLKACCSNTRGRSMSADIESWEINDITGRIKVVMNVTWYGSITGYRYWIKGKLVCDPDGCNPTWTKKEDSKGFSSGCGQNCIKGCLE